MYHLVPHPDRPPDQVRAVQVDVSGDSNGLSIDYTVLGADRLLLPNEGLPRRQDGLWKATCFEAFFRDPATGRYVEFNFSPSLGWAAYSFTGFREGMANLDLAIVPHIARAKAAEPFVLSVDLDLVSIAANFTQLSLTAVIEEEDGTRSFWALAHGAGLPDFHNPACFTATLPARSAP